MLLTESAVRAENERLTEEVADLKRELGLNRDRAAESAFAARWALTGKEAKVLSHLYQKKGGVASKESTMYALYGGSREEPEIKIVDVFVCKIRNKVGDGFIETARGRGYYLSPKAVEACAALCGTPYSEITPCPDDERPRRLRQTDISLRLLRALAEKGPMTLRQLAEHLGATGHATNNRIRTLRTVKRVHIVDQKPSRNNGRPTLVWGLTETGAQYVNARSGVNVG